MSNSPVRKEVPNKKIFEFVTGHTTIHTFQDIYSDILTCKYSSPSEFMTVMWSRYVVRNYSKQLDVRIFRSLLSVLFYREGIYPMHLFVSFNHMPNIDFDFVAYSEENGPIILSAKTSLRERYKQADLEGMMLRHVHRAAKSFLITLDEKEAVTVNKKIKNDLALGLDEVVVATSSEFDALIKRLKGYTYIEPPKVDVLTSKRVIS